VILDLGFEDVDSWPQIKNNKHVEKYCTSLWPLSFSKLDCVGLQECLLEMLCCLSEEEVLGRFVPDDVVKIFMDRFLFLVAKSGWWNYYESFTWLGMSSFDEELIF